ncbi:MAG: L-asparaginase 1, partial [Bacteroidales bacterium]|nr:L-asparaginase 1 [Bacteroidales bacterium]
PLAQSGVHIKWSCPAPAAPKAENKRLIAHTDLEVNVLIVKVHPGMSAEALGLILNTPGLKGVVLGTYGSGNAPTSPAFAQTLADAVQRGIAILNVTQCTEGAVEMGKYAASNPLKAAGVVSGYDMTTEAAVTKMMYVLGLRRPFEETRRLLSTPLRGEMTV